MPVSRHVGACADRCGTCRHRRASPTSRATSAGAMPPERSHVAWTRFLCDFERFAGAHGKTRHPARKRQRTWRSREDLGPRGFVRTRAAPGAGLDSAAWFHPAGKAATRHAEGTPVLGPEIDFGIPVGQGVRTRMAERAGAGMGFAEAVRTVIVKRYADFGGRSSRSEYWWFALFFVLLSILVEAILAMAGPSAAVLSVVVPLALFIPSLAVLIRRLHDLDRSGWWSLIALVPLVNLVLIFWLVRKGTEGDNRFGPDQLQQSH